MCELQYAVNGVLPSRASIDYCYVRPHHIAAVNSLLQNNFWPGIDSKWIKSVVHWIHASHFMLTLSSISSVRMLKLSRFFYCCSLQKTGNRLRFSRTRHWSLCSLCFIYGSPAWMAKSWYCQLYVVSSHTDLHGQGYHIACVGNKSSHLFVSKIWF